MHTDENTLYTLTLRGFVNEFPAKYVQNYELTKKGHQDFWVENVNF